MYRGIEVVSCNITHLHNYTLSLIKCESRRGEKTFVECVECCDSIPVLFVDWLVFYDIYTDLFEHACKWQKQHCRYEPEASVNVGDPA